MRNVVKNGQKKVVAVVLCVGLCVNQAQAFPVFDLSNLVQNTITAVKQVAAYARQLSDGIRQIQEFEKHATEFTNEILGLGDLLDDFNDISNSISDIYKSKDDMEDFWNDFSDDPSEFFKDKFKSYTDNYNIYDKCSGLKGDSLNICVRDKVNYAAGIKQHSDYGNIIDKLRKQLDKQTKEVDRAKSQKDRENAALAIRTTQAEMQKAKELNELESLEYRNNQRIIEEQRQELLHKSLATTYSIADKYKNLGSK